MLFLNTADALRNGMVFIKLKLNSISCGSSLRKIMELCLNPKGDLSHHLLMWIH